MTGGMLVVPADDAQLMIELFWLRSAFVSIADAT